ncbi:MAG: ATP-binding cassette domain-containing protein, partial [bacterium]
MPEERGLYPTMRVGEQLVYFGCLKGLPKKLARTAAGDILDRLGISECWPMRVEQLSKGMQQKVQMAIPLMCPSDLILLDEPFSGLDPISAVEVAALIKARSRHGSLFVISSHQLDMVQKICDSILLMEKGRNILAGKREQIIEPGLTLEQTFLRAVWEYRGTSHD